MVSVAKEQGGEVMSVTKAFWMAVRSNAANGRNLGDTLPQKCLRWFWFSVYLFRAVGIGLRSSCREQIGSRVIYKGQSAIVSNWANHDFVSLRVGNRYVERANRADIQQRLTTSELLYRFRSGFLFYTGYWMQSQINNRVYKMVGTK